jgi:hypothetical protein
MDETYSVRDLFNWFNAVARNKLVVGIEEFDLGLLKRMLGQQQTLDLRKDLAWKIRDNPQTYGKREPLHS